MLTRKVRVQVIAFVVIALLGVSYAGARYAGLDRLVGPRGYVVNVQLANSGGIFSNAEVTYRGVPVGRTGDLQLTGTGINLPLDIDPGAPQIPQQVQAVVAERSAVGEQYVDLRPTNDHGPYLHQGSVIRQTNTQTPVPVEALMTNLDSLAKSVPEDSLRTVVDELGTAFNNNGGNLQRVIDTTREFTAEASAHLPQTRQLLANGVQVMETQNEQGSDIRSFSQNLRLLSEQLKTSDPDLRKVISTAPGTAQQISGLIRENGQLGPLLSNLTITSQVMSTKDNGLEQMFIDYPAIVEGGYTVVPGDGTAHFGMALNNFDPPPCTNGYQGTKPRTGTDTAPMPLNTNARCNVPPGSPTDVRGAQNAPGN